MTILELELATCVHGILVLGYDDYLQRLARSDKLGQQQVETRKALELKGGSESWLVWS